jgi:hypothetical protein
VQEKSETLPHTSVPCLLPTSIGFGGDVVVDWCFTFILFIYLFLQKMYVKSESTVFVLHNEDPLSNKEYPNLDSLYTVEHIQPSKEQCPITYSKMDGTGEHHVKLI